MKTRGCLSVVGVAMGYQDQLHPAGCCQFGQVLFILGARVHNG